MSIFPGDRRKGPGWRVKLTNRNAIPLGTPIEEVLDAVIEYLGLEIYIENDVVKARKKELT